MKLRRGGLVGAAFGLLVLSSVTARAADTWGHVTTSTVKPEVEPDSSAPTGNGVYGRFKGDLELGLGLGAEIDKGGARGAVRLGLHYFSMLGVYSSYRDGFGHGSGDARLLSVGLDLRPLFVPRWAKAKESGHALPDLLIDSISLGLGAFWAKPPGHDFGSERGFETSLGFGVPLMLRADGLWLEGRGQLRWPETAGAPDHSAVPSAFVLLSWHGFVVTPLAASQRAQ